MKNPLKKITFKSKKKELSDTLYSLSELIGDLVAEGEALEKKRHDLDIRCQSLELTVIEQQRKIEALKRVAFENKEKAVKLRQQLHEAQLTAAFYGRMADKVTDENFQLKHGMVCSTMGEGTVKEETEEVSENG